jgi:uncharacterized membrane protein
MHPKMTGKVIVRRSQNLMSPFDLKAILLAKHAQHVTIVHFPIALFVTGVIFDIAAQWRENNAFRVAAYYDLLSAAIASVPAAATGLLAWHFAFKGARIKGLLLDHLLLGCLCTLLLSTVAWLHHHSQLVPEREFPANRIARAVRNRIDRSNRALRWISQRSKQWVIAVGQEHGNMLSNPLFKKCPRNGPLRLK